MPRLEDLAAGARVRGLAPQGVATIKHVEWQGDACVEVLYLDERGIPQQAILFRHDEPNLAFETATRPWSFDADGDLLRLVSEAYRIQLAWLFDPYLAISTSSIQPLPHQISAVYETMLPRQPLRFLLADDPGAGKTIMAGLLIRELMIRGDLTRCLIVSPGSLTDQWQDELSEKFDLEFDLLTRGMLDASRTANPFEQKNLLIARLDQLSRNEDVQQRLKAAPEWDLIVCDEAHRMSAHYTGGEVSYTQRYRLGQRLGEHCRNLLLMTATPHNGRDDDFQLFMALLDGDRFEGRFRPGVHAADPSDLMRRLVKEDLYTFDGRPLFPERRSYTAQYKLTAGEDELYQEVTSYVRAEMNRAERFAGPEQQRRINVGFALMTLQRRLASSPEAIYRSLERRRERLENRVRDERVRARGEPAAVLKSAGPNVTQAEWDELDEEAPQEEREEMEQLLVDNATAARTIAELLTEIERLRDLEVLAKRVRDAASEHDAKWTELTAILDDPTMFDEQGNRRKLVIFTEFRDTLTYIAGRVRTRLGRTEAVVEIHGGVSREDRRRFVLAFMTDPTVLVLVANDAAGEGVNLQRAHLMVNYDLPWNPNRLEQRFGRIHRIGQTEVCHLWNLVAADTREADVYVQLLTKLEDERKALGGKVFDVLGQLFEQRPLRELLVEAICYGDQIEVKERLSQQIANAVDRAHLEELLARRALSRDTMDLSHVEAIRAEMERARARRLQPHFIQGFFLEAFARLGGKVHRREQGRWEITHVPQSLRDRDRLVGTGAPVGHRYERICFEKEHRGPRTTLVCPGNPLLDTTLDLTLEQHRGLLKQGAVLVDEHDLGREPRLLFYLEHAVQDGRRSRDGKFEIVSRRLVFVEVGPDGVFCDAGVAPYLDYRAVSEAERAVLDPVIDAEWMKVDWEQKVMAFALRELVPKHVDEVRGRRLPLIDRVEQQVVARLKKEINGWDREAEDVRAREQAGKRTRRSSKDAAAWADRLSERLAQRLASLKAERSLMPQALGREPRDVGKEKIGYDIESRDPKTGDIYFIEAKGRSEKADTVSLTRKEILTALNVPDRFRLAIVLIEGGQPADPVYVTEFDWGQPGFAQTHSTYSLAALLSRGGVPR